MALLYVTLFQGAAVLTAESRWNVLVEAADLLPEAEALARREAGRRRVEEHTKQVFGWTCKPEASSGGRQQSWAPAVSVCGCEVHSSVALLHSTLFQDAAMRQTEPGTCWALCVDVCQEDASFVNRLSASTSANVCRWDEPITTACQPNNFFDTVHICRYPLLCTSTPGLCPMAATSLLTWWHACTNCMLMLKCDTQMHA